MISLTVRSLHLSINTCADIRTEAQEVRNERALSVYSRVQNKLTGRDFDPDIPLSVPAQVDKLIIQATSLENLCQCFSGWCVCSARRRYLCGSLYC